LLGPPLALFQQVQVCPVLRAPELDAGLPVRSHQSRAEGQSPLPHPAAHTYLIRSLCVSNCCEQKNSVRNTALAFQQNPRLYHMLGSTQKDFSSIAAVHLKTVFISRIKFDKKMHFSTTKF